MTRSPRGRRRLDGINFLVAAAQTGFGPFLTVFLTRAGWSQAEIGLALSVGGIAAMASQLPAGHLVDQIHRKSRAAAIATAAIGLSALMVVVQPTWATVIGSQVVHAFASAMLGPAIAALTLAVRGPADLGEDYGHNARFAAVGSAVAAIALGLSGSYISQRSVLWLTAGMTVPALLLMLHFGDADLIAADPDADHAAMLHPRARRRRALPSWRILRDRALLVFCACAALFFLGNAATLVLASNRLTQHTGAAGVLLSAAIIVPQLIVAGLSPWFGRLAQARGRRPVLLLGFVVQPIRGLLLVASLSPYGLIAGQALDGISGAVFGLMVPLIAADVTARTGCFNLAMGAINLAVGLGASLSTALGGLIAQRFGYPLAFLALAAAGGCATLLVWLVMPETLPQPQLPGAAAGGSRAERLLSPEPRPGA